MPVTRKSLHALAGLMPVVALASALCSPLPAQEPLSFDAASVKPSDPEISATPLPFGPPGAPRRLMWRMVSEGGPGTDDPGRIRYTKPLLFLVAEAFEVMPMQVRGPDWLFEEHFDIDAVMPSTTTRHEFHLMLQNLLVKRFQLSFHRETIPVPGYALVMANKRRPLFQTASANNQPDGAAPIYYGDGLIKPRFTGTPGIHGTEQNRGLVVAFEHQTMADLALYLKDELDCPVVDATGLPAPNNFALAFYPPHWKDPANGTKTLPNLFKALKTQLGLNLERKRLPGPRIVIDHIELVPPEN